MRGKILLLAGVAVGYVLGARAGREKYNELVSTANKFWNDPRVQDKVEQVQGFVKEKGPEVSGFVQDNAKKVSDTVTGKKKSGNGGATGGTSGGTTSGTTSGTTGTTGGTTSGTSTGTPGTTTPSASS
jgi:hypothetical protein